MFLTLISIKRRAQIAKLSSCLSCDQWGRLSWEKDQVKVSNQGKSHVQSRVWCIPFRLSSVWGKFIAQSWGKVADQGKGVKLEPLQHTSRWESLRTTTLNYSASIHVKIDITGKASQKNPPDLYLPQDRQWN